MGVIRCVVRARRIAALVGVTAAAAAVVATVGLRAADIATTGPVADATVSSARPAANSGRTRTLVVSARPRALAYVQFVAPAAASTSESVTLRLYATSRPRGTFAVRRAASEAWRERGITARNAPRAVAPAVTFAPRAAGWASVDVTRLVRASGRVTLVVSTASGRGVFASRETSRRPQLVVAQAASTDPVLLAAGDVAGCNVNGDEITAAMIDKLPGTVAALGDLAYENGTDTEFANCYAPSWGRFKDRTRPAVGNHEYQTPNATGYFNYWGSAAGNPAQGYYSYELGSWHVVVLNSMCAAGCSAGTQQEQWLRADLAAHPAKCTLAYWHHPLFSSGEVPPATDARAFWDDLYAGGAEVVLNGHAHNYQRYAPQTPSGQADAARGIREFVVGTGGRSHHSATPRATNEEVVNDTTFGVLRLVLHANSYDWKFLPEPGKTFTDSGSGTCH